MMYERERTQIVEAVQVLLTTGVMDNSGGAISVRAGDHILMTPAGASFRRWTVSPDEVVVLTANGDIVEGGQYKAAASLPMSLKVFAHMPDSNVIMHAHAPWSLIYACSGRQIPSVTNSSAAFGEMPLFGQTAWDVVEAARLNPQSITVPPGMVNRPDVVAVNFSIADEILAAFYPRQDELARHSLICTLASHGIVVVSRRLDQALDNIQKVEISARVAWHLEAAAERGSFVDSTQAVETVPAQVRL